MHKFIKNYSFFDKNDNKKGSSEPASDANSTMKNVDYATSKYYSLIKNHENNIRNIKSPSSTNR